MQDMQHQVETLRRPGLLLRAARAGMLGYNRNRDLRRLMHDTVPPPDIAVRRLIDAEAHAEENRRAGTTGYSLVEHVDLLIALLAELTLLGRVEDAA